MVKIFIANLTDECTNEDLQTLFSQYGNVTECDKLPDKPIGFVHMDDQKSAEQAVRKINGLAYKGKRLKVELSNTKPIKIFIGNVPHEATSKDLRTVFEDSGLEIHKCDKVEGKGIGFAHVSSSKGFKEINRAILELNGYNLKDRALNIEISMGGITKQQHFMAKQDEEYTHGYTPDDFGVDPGRGFMRGRGGFRGGGRHMPYPMGGRGGFAGGPGGYNGFADDDFYPMEPHMNKMWGGYDDPVTLEGPFSRGGYNEPVTLEGPFARPGGIRNPVTLEGPFSRGIAGAVNGWANQAKAKKVEQQNRLAEKKSQLFDHNNSTMLAMLETGQLSDYKLQCEDEVLDVHKMILAARSPFFVEIMMKNPEQCVITNIDMETLRLLVKFMYTSLVDISNISPRVILKLLKAAETYQVEMVKEGLEGALMEGIDKETVVEYLIIAEELQLFDLKAAAVNFIGQRSKEMKQRGDLRLKLKDYPHLMMELFEAVAGD